MLSLEGNDFITRAHRDLSNSQAPHMPQTREVGAFSQSLMRTYLNEVELFVTGTLVAACRRSSTLNGVFVFVF